MIYIRKKCDIKNSYKTLTHSDKVFCEALEYIRAGEKYFNVVNSFGEDYGLEYIPNGQAVRSYKSVMHDLNFQGEIPYPDYLFYNENDKESLYMDIFNDYLGVYLKNINEYTIIIAKVLLKYTDKKIYISDKRFFYFLDKSSKVTFVDKSEDINEKNLMTVIDDFVMEAYIGNHKLIDSITLFHNIFIMQYIFSLSKDGLKTLIISIPKSEGIGSILTSTMRIKAICNKYGLNVYLKSNCTRYTDKLLKKYFNIPLEEDFNINIKNTNDGMVDSFYIDKGMIFATFMFTDIFQKQKDALTDDALNKQFKKDLEQYKQAVFKEKKVLGVLARGSDYIATNMPNQPLKIDKLISLITDIKNKGNYELIFLATEDKDYFEKFRESFKDEMIAISQKRISVTDLEKCALISELEKEKTTKDNYNNVLEDNMVNYFYAVYLLSKCNGFLATPDCGGAFMALAFNENKFEYSNVVSRNLGGK